MINTRLFFMLLALILISACGSSTTQSTEDNNDPNTPSVPPVTTDPNTPSTDPVTTAPDASISIISPAADNQTIRGTYNLQATIESTDNIVQASFSINDVIIGTDTNQPFNYQWNTVNYNDGNYRLVVSTTNSNGTTSYSSSRLSNISNNQSVSGCTLTSTEQALLDTHNAARAQARQCGDEQFAATNPLQWNCTLASAAQAHSDDMIQNNFFDHDGSNGSKPWDRATDAGYVYRTIGENIAANQRSVDSVMTGWLNSPGHCANIMNPNFKEIGANRTDSTSSRYSTYWTALFGAQR